jgi:hypothetical protein
MDEKFMMGIQNGSACFWPAVEQAGKSVFAPTFKVFAIRQRVARLYHFYGNGDALTSARIVMQDA